MGDCNNISELEQKCMVAFIFDSGKFDTCSYGNKAMEYIFKGRELKGNNTKIVVSLGDIDGREASIDISPYVNFDDLCSIGMNTVVDKDSDSIKGLPQGCISFKDYPFAIVMEDIDKEVVKKLDSRLKIDSKEYVGVTNIDVKTSDQRKQFWKKMIRFFSLEEDVCTVFGESKEGFIFDKQVIDGGYMIRYDEFPSSGILGFGYQMYSTRQSSYIYKYDQLVPVKGKNDSDRGLFRMNFALVKELEIAGVQIWKAIEDINKVYLSKDCDSCIIDFLFTSFYQASQGVERLLKIAVELVAYTEKNTEKNKTDKILYSHNHVALADYLEKKNKLKLDSACRNLLNMLMTFYNEGRYNRYLDSAEDTLELKILAKLGKSLRAEDFDQEFKKMYGKLLGNISRGCYELIYNISHEINVYVYDFNKTSIARMVFWDSYDKNLYKSLLKFENAKKEMLWYLINNGSSIKDKYVQANIDPLEFDGIDEYIFEMIRDNLGESFIEDFIDEEYIELKTNQKEAVKERISFLNYLFGNNGAID